MATSSLDKRMKAATNEHLRKIYNTTEPSHMPKRRGLVKKHNCLLKTTKSEASLRPDSASSRPSTRRNSNATPKEPLPIKSYSMGPSKFGQIFKFRQRKRPSVAGTRSNNSELQSAILQPDSQQSSSRRSDIETPPNTAIPENRENDAVKPPQSSDDSEVLPKSSEEHEYLLFLLRITEDIISNDFYSNSDIKKIFKNHMELNKDRLNMRKMRLHIGNLCKELNIDCKEYHTVEVSSDESDSPSKFQNSPTGHNYILNNNAFKNCQDCSVIRSSSLYQIHSAEYCALGDTLRMPFSDNGGDNASISPSLLKLLDKLSLGRVTECTEPVASTSTVNSPRFNLPDTLEMDEINNSEDAAAKEPVDFDTFVKALNKGDISSEPPDSVITTESPPVETGKAVIKEEQIENPDLLKSGNISEGVDFSPQTLQVPTSKSEEELTGKEIGSQNASEKYESEFEKCSSNNSLLTSVLKLDINEGFPKQSLEENKSHEELISERAESRDKMIKHSKIPIIKRVGKCESLPQLMCLIDKTDETSTTSSKSFTTSRIASESLHSRIEQQQMGTSSTKNRLSSSAQSLQNNQNENIEEPKVLPDNKEIVKSPLKVILQGTVNDDDYVMIKGPVYVYKPLLESEPKLVVFADQKPRRDSLDSQHSHRTFTVDNSHVLDQAIQYDTSLHSLEAYNSMDNILKLTKTAYSQFIDMKLLQSDYDLTPERDETDNKYHHLMVDATTSISGVNITESLLLNDDYLMKGDVGQTKVETEKDTVADLNGYVKFEPKMYENNYVIHKKLVSSVSMPKLKLDSGRSYVGRNNERARRSGNVLKKCSNSLIDIDAPSQDSSIRSEGEALQHFDYAKNGVAWNIYYNKK